MVTEGGGAVSHEAEILAPALGEEGEGVGGRGRLGMCRHGRMKIEIES